MADEKLTELDEATEATTDDILYIVVDPGTTPTSKKIKVENLLAGNADILMFQVFS